MAVPAKWLACRGGWSEQTEVEGGCLQEKCSEDIRSTHCTLRLAWSKVCCARVRKWEEASSAAVTEG